MRLAELASRRGGPVSHAELARLGFTDDQIAWRCRHGRLHRIFYNAYCVGHRSLTDHAMLHAALLSAGPTAFLGHRTAAAAYGLRPVNRHALELTVPGGSRRRRPPILIHRTRHEPHRGDLATRNGLRVAGVPLMLVQLAGIEDQRELERLLSLVVARRLLRLDTPAGLRTLEATVARHPRHAGAAALNAALRAYRRIGRHDSWLEVRFDEIIAADPLIPEPQHNVKLNGWQLDRFWPEHRLAVELDGRGYHVAAKEMDRDRRKDLAMQRLGIQLLRYTDMMVEHDAAQIRADLHQFLHLELERAA